ncbi:hypothetical protein AVEN_155994-1 [Araneus ventricosus]|uniref:Uncharacterized protein n=1 Tax=Araneus ventricosus TaxID=182803 RepID=A0A4Y2JDM8_ARAVE|nr:hypothetical protein AVEN_155994-1 [Araneus ventricosus]
MEAKSDSLAAVLGEWNELKKSFPEVEALQKSCTKAVVSFKKVEADFKKAISEQVKGVTRVSESLKCLRPTSEKEKDEYNELKKSVNVRKEELRTMSSTLPKDSG